MIDSGAFTFFSCGEHPNFDEYTEKYGEFIKGSGVNLFFEMDIDSIVGLPKVLELRKKLEKITGKQPIPVWHISRGKKQFLRDAEEYPYIALGGIVSGEWRGGKTKHFPWFIKSAHEKGAKIHALGYTSLKGLPKYHFDSVDSTGWLAGGKFGFVWKYKNGTLEKIPAPAGKMLNSKKVVKNNFIEWCKFSSYAKTHFRRVRKPHEKTI